VWWNWNDAFDRIEVDEDAEAKKRFETWKAGRTGFPIVDAGMRQLSERGFMHNRVRMIVASFLVKDLHLPWQWGARWFLDQLVDGDMASNQHGWQWAAGCGTDAAPYFRVFNPDTQAKKFDPDEEYVRRWVPEFGTPDYPDPMVDHGAERAEALRRYQAIR
jgi:deoxyribodipyrimidine photo-lyase